jgi:hypothetical protein
MPRGAAATWGGGDRARVCTWPRWPLDGVDSSGWWQAGQQARPENMRRFPQPAAVALQLSQRRSGGR